MKENFVPNVELTPTSPPPRRLSGRPVSPKSAMEQEKRIRREIANSNERKRMQSINAGFNALKSLLPHHEGEKLSKVRREAVWKRCLGPHLYGVFE